MNKFVHGTRKSADFMVGLIKALSPQERIDAALFLSHQPGTKKNHRSERPLLCRQAAAYFLNRSSGEAGISGLSDVPPNSASSALRLACAIAAPPPL